MDCHHYDAGRCRSCTWLALPYAVQLAQKQQRCAVALPDSLTWLPPIGSAESGFRNKAKMVVSGTVAEPLLGIVGPRGPVDLTDCGLHEPALQEALPVLASFVTTAALVPYDVEARTGELKFVLATVAPGGALMVRWVCRSQEPVSRIRKHLAWLTARLPQLAVASVNVQPEHKAVLEGDREIVLTTRSGLPVPVNGRALTLRPQSFFQTNTAIAAALYREAAAWAAEKAPRRILDLYCGVGGFALHLAGEGRTVLGIEVSDEAVASARANAAGVEGVRFLVGDASDPSVIAGQATDLVVVNPPRRGLGPGLARAIEASTVPTVLYSSCNPDSLAADLAQMPSLEAVRGRVFDMFPQTGHAEVLVQLERRSR